MVVKIPRLNETHLKNYLDFLECSPCILDVLMFNSWRRMKIAGSCGLVLEAEPCHVLCEERDIPRISFRIRYDLL